jgi:outer membrane protein OmpA-like peptidoglycan-associated protein
MSLAFSAIRLYETVQRLARYLQKNPTPLQVLLAGFTDDIGGASANLELARKRADAARRELVALGVQRYARDVQVEGFGKVLPVACNDTERSVGKRTAASRCFSCDEPRSCT